MDPPGSVSAWIDQLKAGDHDAAQQLWHRYFHRLVGLARSRLQGLCRAAADEEDVALSVFTSFCAGVAGGQFPPQLDRDDLWPLLVLLTVRKAQRLQRDQHRQKRGGGRVVTEADCGASEGSDEPFLARVKGSEPDPSFAAEMAESCERLLTRLGDAALRGIALWKMEGHGNAEIAARLGCGLRTVERKLECIRILWQSEVGS